MKRAIIPASGFQAVVAQVEQTLSSTSTPSILIQKYTENSKDTYIVTISNWYSYQAHINFNYSQYNYNIFMTFLGSGSGGEEGTKRFTVDKIEDLNAFKTLINNPNFFQEYTGPIPAYSAIKTNFYTVGYGNPYSV